MFAKECTSQFLLNPHYRFVPMGKIRNIPESSLKIPYTSLLLIIYKSVSSDNTQTKRDIP